MKVLRLQIQSEHVGEQDIQRARNIPHGIGLQITWRVELGGPGFGISNSNLHFIYPSVSSLYWTVRRSTRVEDDATPSKNMGFRHVTDLIQVRQEAVPNYPVG
jgi:hypothetical protein